MQAARRQGESYVSPDYRMLRLLSPLHHRRTLCRRPRQRSSLGCVARVHLTAARRAGQRASVRSRRARPPLGARGAHRPDARAPRVTYAGVRALADNSYRTSECTKSSQKPRE
jgi:hypothetical protein